jgi:hypothetical protein
MDAIRKACRGLRNAHTERISEPETEPDTLRDDHLLQRDVWICASGEQPDIPKTLGGQVFTPCRMEIKKSQQSSTPVSDSTIKFSRLAQDFKQKLKLWKAHARITPISATYQQFDAADMSTAINSWTLYVDDCSMDDTDVTCILTRVRAYD